MGFDKDTQGPGGDMKLDDKWILNLTFDLLEITAKYLPIHKLPS